MKSTTKSNWLIWIAIITSIAGLIIYIVTSTTGYLAGTSVNYLPVILTVIALVLAFVLARFPHKLKPLLIDLFVFVSTVCLIASFSLFILGRIGLAADVYFIPVNYPEAEEIALNISIIGFISYLVSIITMIIVSFSDNIQDK